MDQDAFLTPRKIFQNAFNAARLSTNTGASSPTVAAVYTPTRSLSGRSGGGGGGGGSRFNMFPVIHTPPSRMLNGRVINPFEAHLAERLHLPVICSPSLFQRPSTPLNGTGATSQFEWTIDEVSSLGPANVEAHETQFMETPDPVLEAKAQAAISAYFKEHNIVPSPVDCPLRNQKIILKAESSFSGSFPGRKSKRKRDGITQTVLSFPPTLPKEVEDMLAPFFNFHDNQQQTHEAINESTTGDVSIDHDARDASLRRKLFNTSVASIAGSGSDRDDSFDQMDLRALSPAPASPELDKDSAQHLKRSRRFSSQDDIRIDPGDISISPVVARNKESFGALSPISKSSASPSPMKPNLHSTELPVAVGDSATLDAIYRSTPERPKTGGFSMNCSSANNSHHMSVELNDSHHRAYKNADLTVDLADEDLSFEEDNLFTFSSQSSSSAVSQQHPTTPLRRTSRENRNRKNLSHSFLLYSDEDRFEEEQLKLATATTQSRRSFSEVAGGKENAAPRVSFVAAKSAPTGGNFKRMDSGFNEETDVSMSSSECCEVIVVRGTQTRL